MKTINLTTYVTAVPAGCREVAAAFNFVSDRTVPVRSEATAYSVFDFTTLVVELKRQPSRSVRSSKGRLHTTGLHH